VLNTLGHTHAGYMTTLCKPKVSPLYFRSTLSTSKNRADSKKDVMELLPLVMKLLLLVVGLKQNQC